MVRVWGKITKEGERGCWEHWNLCSGRQRRLSKKGAEHRPAGAEVGGRTCVWGSLRRGQGPPGRREQGGQGGPWRTVGSDGTESCGPCKGLGFASHTSGPCGASGRWSLRLTLTFLVFLYLFLAVLDLLFSAAEGGSVLLSRSSGSRAFRLLWLRCVGSDCSSRTLGHRLNSCAARAYLLQAMRGLP